MDARQWALAILERAAVRLVEADEESVEEELVLFARGLNSLDRALAMPGLPKLPPSLATSVRLGALH